MSGQLNLHSIMVKFEGINTAITTTKVVYLHSIMVKFEDIEIDLFQTCRLYLHSIMVKFEVDKRVLFSEALKEFTFHYGEI